MTAAQVELQLQPWRRRALILLALRWALIAVAASSVWGALVLVEERLRPEPHRNALLLAGTAVAVVAAASCWYARRPSLTWVARTADSRLALKERLATALALSHAQGRLEAQLVADAVSQVATHRPADAFPLVRLRRLALTSGAVLVAFAVVSFTPNSMAETLRRQEADATSISAAAGEIRKAESRLAGAGPAANAATQKKADQALRKALETLSNTTSPAQALEALSALQEALGQLHDPSAVTRGSAAQAAGAPLSKAAAASLSGVVAAGALARDLSAGDNSRAAADATSLAAAIPSLGSGQQSALAQALGDAAHEARADPALQKGFAAAADSLRSGDVPAAQRALSDVRNSLSAIARQEASNAALSQALAAVAGAKSATAAQADRDASSTSPDSGVQGPGAGPRQTQTQTQGQGQGQGHGQGQGLGAGGGAGQGGGGSGAPLSRGAASTERIYVAGGPQGDVVAAPDAGPLGRGTDVPTQSFQSLLPAFAQTALDAMDRSVFSIGDRDLVRSYFLSLAP